MRSGAARVGQPGVGTALDQQPGVVLAELDDRQVQRRAPLVVKGVHRGSAGQEERNDLRIRPASGGNGVMPLWLW